MQRISNAGQQVFDENVFSAVGVASNEVAGLAVFSGTSTGTWTPLSALTGRGSALSDFDHVCLAELLGGFGQR